MRHVRGAESRRMEQHGVAIRRGLGGLTDADGAAGARLALDDDRLAELLLELLEHDPRGHVIGVAGREWNDGCDVA